MCTRSQRTHWDTWRFSCPVINSPGRSACRRERDRPIRAIRRRWLINEAKPFGRGLHAQQGEVVMSDPVNVRRRRLLGTSLAGLTLADFAFGGLAHAQSAG